MSTPALPWQAETQKSTHSACFNICCYSCRPTSANKLHWIPLHKSKIETVLITSDTNEFAEPGFLGSFRLSSGKISSAISAGICHLCRIALRMVLSSKGQSGRTTSPHLQNWQGAHSENGLKQMPLLGSTRAGFSAGTSMQLQ